MVKYKTCYAVLYIPLQKGNTRLELCRMKVCEINQLKYLNTLKYRSEFTIFFQENKGYIYYGTSLPQASWIITGHAKTDRCPNSS